MVAYNSSMNDYKLHPLQVLARRVTYSSATLSMRLRMSIAALPTIRTIFRRMVGFTRRRPTGLTKLMVFPV
jgi:hypothetical protein